MKKRVVLFVVLVALLVALPVASDFQMVQHTQTTETVVDTIEIPLLAGSYSGTDSYDGTESVTYGTVVDKDLTEESYIISSSTTESSVGFGTFPPTGWSNANWEQEGSGGQSGAYAKIYRDPIGSSPTWGYLVTDTHDMSSYEKLKIQFYWSTQDANNALENGDFYVQSYEGGGYSTVWSSTSNPTGWDYESVERSWTGSGWKVRFYADLDTDGEGVGLDTVKLVGVDETTYYRFEAVFKFTNVDPYASTMDLVYDPLLAGSSETLDFYVGTSTDPNTLLKSDWIGDDSFTEDVSSYVTGSSFYVKIKDCVRSGDTDQDTWVMDDLYLDWVRNDPSVTDSPDPAATVFYSQYDTYTISIYVGDADGAGDLSSAYVDIYDNTRTDKQFRLSWMAPDTYSITNDQGSAILESGSKSWTVFGGSPDEYGYRLDFNIKLNWAQDHLTAVDSYVYVEDEDTNSDSAWYESDWDFENRLQLTSYNVLDDSGGDRGALNTELSATGTLAYYGASSLHPSSNVVDVWVSAGSYGSEVGPWSDTTFSDGQFDVTAYADDSVGQVTYTFKAVDDGAGSGGTNLLDTSYTDTYIADRPIVTAFSTEDGNIDVGTSASFSITIQYEYDNDPVESGTVKIEGIDATHSAGGVWTFTDVSYSALSKTFDSGSFSGGSYSMDSCSINFDGNSVTQIWNEIVATSVTSNLDYASPSTTIRIYIDGELAIGTHYLDGNDRILVYASDTGQSSLMTWDNGKDLFYYDAVRDSEASVTFSMSTLNADEDTYDITAVNPNSLSVTVRWTDISPDSIDSFAESKDWNGTYSLAPYVTYTEEGSIEGFSETIDSDSALDPDSDTNGDFSKSEWSFEEIGNQDDTPLDPDSDTNADAVYSEWDFSETIDPDSYFYPDNETLWGSKYVDSFAGVGDWSIREGTGISTDGDVANFEVAGDNAYDYYYDNSISLAAGTGCFVEIRLKSNVSGSDFLVRLYEQDDYSGISTIIILEGSVSTNWYTPRAYFDGSHAVESIQIGGRHPEPTQFWIDYLRVGNVNGWAHDGSTTAGIQTDNLEGVDFTYSSGGDYLTLNATATETYTGSWPDYYIHFDTTSTEINLESDYYSWVEIKLSIDVEGCNFYFDVAMDGYRNNPLKIWTGDATEAVYRFNVAEMQTVHSGNYIWFFANFADVGDSFEVDIDYIRIFGFNNWTYAGYSASDTTSTAYFNDTENAVVLEQSLGSTTDYFALNTRNASIDYDSTDMVVTFTAKAEENTTVRIRPYYVSGEISDQSKFYYLCDQWQTISMPMSTTSHKIDRLYFFFYDWIDGSPSSGTGRIYIKDNVTIRPSWYISDIDYEENFNDVSDWSIINAEYEPTSDGDYGIFVPGNDGSWDYWKTTALSLPEGDYSLEWKYRANETNDYTLLVQVQLFSDDACTTSVYDSLNTYPHSSDFITHKVSFSGSVEAIRFQIKTNQEDLSVEFDYLTIGKGDITGEVWSESFSNIADWDFYSDSSTYDSKSTNGDYISWEIGATGDSHYLYCDVPSGSYDYFEVRYRYNTTIGTYAVPYARTSNFPNGDIVFWDGRSDLRDDSTDWTVKRWRAGEHIESFYLYINPTDDKTLDIDYVRGGNITEHGFQIDGSSVVHNSLGSGAMADNEIRAFSTGSAIQLQGDFSDGKGDFYCYLDNLNIATDEYPFMEIQIRTESQATMRAYHGDTATWILSDMSSTSGFKTYRANIAEVASVLDSLRIYLLDSGSEYTTLNGFVNYIKFYSLQEWTFATGQSGSDCDSVAHYDESEDALVLSQSLSDTSPRDYMRINTRNESIDYNVADMTALLTVKASANETAQLRYFAEAGNDADLYYSLYDDWQTIAVPIPSDAQTLDYFSIYLFDWTISTPSSGTGQLYIKNNLTLRPSWYDATKDAAHSWSDSMANVTDWEMQSNEATESISTTGDYMILTSNTDDNGADYFYTNTPSGSFTYLEIRYKYNESRSDWWSLFGSPDDGVDNNYAWGTEQIGYCYATSDFVTKRWYIGDYSAIECLYFYVGGEGANNGYEMHIDYIRLSNGTHDGYQIDCSTRAEWKKGSSASTDTYVVQDGGSLSFENGDSFEDYDFDFNDFDTEHYPFVEISVSELDGSWWKFYVWDADDTQTMVIGETSTTGIFRANVKAAVGNSIIKYCRLYYDTGVDIEYIKFYSIANYSYASGSVGTDEYFYVTSGTLKSVKTSTTWMQLGYDPSLSVDTDTYNIWNISTDNIDPRGGEGQSFNFKPVVGGSLESNIDESRGNYENDGTLTHFVLVFYNLGYEMNISAITFMSDYVEVDTTDIDATEYPFMSLNITSGSGNFNITAYNGSSWIDVVVDKTISIGISRYNVLRATDSLTKFRVVLDMLSDPTSSPSIEVAEHYFYGIVNWTFRQSTNAQAEDCYYVEDSVLHRASSGANLDYLTLSYDPTMSVDVGSYNVRNLTLSWSDESDNYDGGVFGIRGYVDSSWESWTEGESRSTFTADSGTLTDIEFTSYTAGSLSNIRFWGDYEKPDVIRATSNPDNPTTVSDVVLSTVVSDDWGAYEVSFIPIVAPSAFGSPTLQASMTVEGFWQYEFTESLPEGYYCFVVSVSDAVQTNERDYYSYIDFSVIRNEITVYVRMFDTLGDFIPFETFEVFKNGSRLYTDTFSGYEDEAYNITIVDRWGTTLDSTAYAAGTIEIVPTLDVNSLKVMSWHEDFTYFSLTQEGRTFTQVICPLEVVEYRLWDGNYSWLVDYRNGTTVEGNTNLVNSTAIVLTGSSIADVAGYTETLLDLTSNINVTVEATNNQVLTISIDLTNVNTTIHEQLIEVLLDIDNVDSDLYSQTTTLLAEIQNSNSTLFDQTVQILADIDSVNSTVFSQTVDILSNIENTNSTLYNQTLDILANITNTNSTIHSQLLSVLADISNVNSTLYGQTLEIIADIDNINSTLFDQTVSILSDISNMNTTLYAQTVDILSNVQNTNSTLYSQTVSILSNIENTNSTIYSQTVDILSRIENVNSTIFDQTVQILSDIQNVNSTLYNQTLDILTHVSTNGTLYNQTISVLAKITNVNATIMNQTIQNLQYIRNTNSTIYTQLISNLQKIENIQTIVKDVEETAERIKNDTSVIDNLDTSVDVSPTTSMIVGLLALLVTVTVLGYGIAWFRLRKKQIVNDRVARAQGI